jgi:hypothetical protein
VQLLYSGPLTTDGSTKWEILLDYFQEYAVRQCANQGVHELPTDPLREWLPIFLITNTCLRGSDQSVVDFVALCVSFRVSHVVSHESCLFGECALKDVLDLLKDLFFDVVVRRPPSPQVDCIPCMVSHRARYLELGYGRIEDVAKVVYPANAPPPTIFLTDHLQKLERQLRYAEVLPAVVFPISILDELEPNLLLKALALLTFDVQG